MSYKYSPMVVVPLALVAAVGMTWLVGALQPKGESANAAILPAPGQPKDEAASIVADVAGPSLVPPSAVDKHPEFPAFSGPTASGADFSLAANKGKVVLVNFWATWCGPCKMEIPDLIELQKKYGSRGFTVVGLSEDDQFSQASAFAKSAGLNYPVLKTPDGLAASLGIRGLPTSVLVGKDGKVISSMSGVDPSQSMAGLWAPQIEKAL